MRKIALLLLCLSVLIGCGHIKQGIQDTKTGLSSPVEEGEKSPKDEAREITDILAPIPYVGTAVPVLIVPLTFFFAWRRGRRIRKNLPVNKNPITGSWGQKVGLEAIVQEASNVIAGLFEVGKEGSGLRRVWKVGLALLFGLGTTAAASPDAQRFILSHPDVIALIGALSAGFAGLEKKLSQVQPLLESPVSAANPTI